MPPRVWSLYVIAYNFWLQTNHVHLVCLCVIGRDTNVQSTEVTSNSVRSNSPDASLSGRHENLRNNLPDDVIILTPSEESHYSDHSLLAITTSFAQELPHESPQLLANEQISQVSNPYSDEEEIREEPLLSTLQAAFLGIPDPINHSTQQVIYMCVYIYIYIYMCVCVCKSNTKFFTKEKITWVNWACVKCCP